MDNSSYSALPTKLQKAKEALLVGDITSAEILTKEYLIANKSSEVALRTRLEVLSRMRDFEGAVEIVARLIQLLGESRDLFFEGAYYAELGGNLELALKGYEKVLELEPLDVLALLGLGRTLLNSVGISGAEAFFARAYELEPDNREAAEYLALAYEKEADYTKGIPFCEGAIEKFPESWLLLVVLGNLWGDNGKSSKGLLFVSKGLAKAPEEAKPYISAAALLNKMHRPFEALAFLDKASKLAPGDLNIMLEKSSLLRDTGSSKEAIEILEQVFRYVPNFAQARSNYLLYLHDINGISRERIFDESQRYGQEVAGSIIPIAAEFENKLSLDRKISLGILSSDMREHSVAYFLLPLLEEIDREKFVVTLFCSNAWDDKMTERFKGLADIFVSIRDMHASAVAEKIRDKKIDVLFELGGHTANAQVNVCAYRAAPVQVNWLGYPDTTGVCGIDYRIVDSVTDPIGDADNFATEELIRMERGFLCYSPPSGVGTISPLPAQDNSFITFGSFSNMAKINPDMIALWSKLLQDNPSAKLLLKNKALSEEEGRDIIKKRFEVHGIDGSRLILVGMTTKTLDHLDYYSKIDIALDTFPYNGTTTICEALYMGVPMIGLCGKTHASRVGASLLSRVGLEQLVASSPQQYLQIASALANQVDDLRMLRTGMRDRLEASGLLDKKAFADEFSRIVIGLWKRYVDSKG